MADFEQRLRELEDTLTDTEGVLRRQKAPMPNDDVDDSIEKGKGFCFPYVYIIGVLIPLITVAALYFAKPKFVTKKVKGKQVVCMKSLLKWTAVITAVGWVVLYLINYYGVFNNAVARFGK